MIQSKRKQAWNFSDKLGKQYTQLKVIKNVSIPGKSLWECLCSCGNKTTVSGGALSSGKTKSCGCRRIIAGRAKIRHGKSHTRIHNLWCDIKKRCSNKNIRYYHRYGGRGITLCERWMSFENFDADICSEIGPPPQKMSLDRINNNGNYEPGNVRWATNKQQTNNTCRNVFIEFNGKRQTISQWADELGILKGTIHWRYQAGLSPASILSKSSLPLRGNPNKRKGNRIIEFQNKKQTLTEWSREIGISAGTLWWRLEQGWEPKRVLTQYVR